MQNRSRQGMYFHSLASPTAPLPSWPEAQTLLPAPVFDERPEAVDAYWHAWNLALNSMQSPLPGSGLVSNHMFFAFNDAIFAHDSSLMTLYGSFGHRLFNAIETLDNFYVKQHPTGEICREIDRVSGRDAWPNEEGDDLSVRLEGPWEKYGGDWSRVAYYTWKRLHADRSPTPLVRVDGYSDHKFHWAEWRHYTRTGDAERLARVLPPLEKLYRAYQVYLQDENGLYIMDWAGMDNSPRNTFLGYGVDLSSQMAFFALTLARMHEALDRPADAGIFRREAQEQGERVRRLMWNPATGMFHDRTFHGDLAPVKTVMGFAPLLGCDPTPEQGESLVAQLNNPATFNRPVRVPSLAADEPSYSPHGEYYLGGVWPFTNAMAIEGLESCGHRETASAIALNYWRAAVDVFRDTGTVWEYLSPEAAKPGRGSNPSDPGKNARPDFAGWGAYPLIATFLEHAIGLRADAPSMSLTWHLQSTRRCGCHRFALGDADIDLVVASRNDPEAEPELETAGTNAPFDLHLHWGSGQSRQLRIEATPSGTAPGQAPAC